MHSAIHVEANSTTSNFQSYIFNILPSNIISIIHSLRCASCVINFLRHFCMAVQCAFPTRSQCVNKENRLSIKLYFTVLFKIST